MTVPFMPAFAADLLMRPVKFVRAKGAVFVCGGKQIIPADAGATTDWVIHRNNMLKDSTATWREIFRKVEDRQIYPYCGAYAAVGANPVTGNKGKPTFIMAGSRQQLAGGDPDDPANSQQVIFTSIGGETWTESRRENAGFCYAAGWSEADKKFYVQCIGDSVPGTAIFNYVVLASTDGVAWSRADSVPGEGFGNYAHPLLMATGNELVKDSDNQIVPNGGYYGWDKVRNITITPKVLAPYFPNYPGADATNQIEVIKKIINPETGAVTITRTTKTLLIDQVTCVAFAKDIWQAAGFMGEGPDPEGAVLKIATSIDDGDTWNFSYTVAAESQAFCLMGAPPEMFS